MAEKLTTEVILTPYLCVKGASDAIAFYQKAFGATEVLRLAEPNGRIGHAEIRIGNAQVYLSDEFPDHGIVSPATLGGSPVFMSLDVPDADAVFSQALAAGATEVRPLKDEFYGYRVGQVRDPFGHKWGIGTKIEEVSPEEMQKRAAALFGGAQ